MVVIPITNYCFLNLCYLLDINNHITLFLTNCWIFIKGKKSVFYIKRFRYLIIWDTPNIYWLKRIRHNILNIFKIFKSLIHPLCVFLIGLLTIFNKVL